MRYYETQIFDYDSQEEFDEMLTKLPTTWHIVNIKEQDFGDIVEPRYRAEVKFVISD